MISKAGGEDGRSPIVHTDSSLRITTLGKCQLVRSGPTGSLTIYEKRNKELSLLVYLACAPGRTATRTHLQNLFWGALSPDNAQGALRNTMWKLRKTLTTDGIVGETAIRLVASCTVDRDLLLDAAARGDSAQVIELYTGPFLPESSHPDGAEFDEWIQVERTRLRRIFLRSAEREVNEQVDRGSFQSALALARRVRDEAVTEELGWELTLQTLLAAGDTIAASDELAAWQHIVDTEQLDLSPSSLKMMKDVRKAGGATTVIESLSSILVAPLIDRDREFAEVVNEWHSARAGARRMVHIEGIAGIGKSRLLTDCGTRISREKVTLLRVQGLVARANMPYAFAASVAAALSRRRGASGISTGSIGALLALDPTLSSHMAGEIDQSAGPEAMRRRSIAMEELLSAVIAERPLILLLDDIQWADTSSLQMLAAATAGLSDVPLLIVSAARTHLPEALASLSPKSLVLHPLSTEGVSDLVGSLGALPDEDWARKLPQLLHNASGGVPLYVLDALQLAIEHGLLERTPNGWCTSSSRGLTDVLAQGATLARRIAGLPSVQRAILLTLAILGEPCDRELLVATGNSKDRDLSAELNDLERMGLVVSSTTEARIAHDAIREVSIASASPIEIRESHRMLTKAMRVVSLNRTSVLEALLLIRSAVRHAQMSGDELELQEAFGQYATLSLKRGGRQSLVSIAAETLGDSSTADQCERLVRSLPLRNRLRNRVRARTVITATLATLALFAVAVFELTTRAGGPSTIPDAQLAIWTIAGDSLTIGWAAFSSASWNANDTLHLGPLQQSVTLPLDVYIDDAVATRSPNSGWIVPATHNDSGAIDLVWFTEDGRRRRLTSAKGDDVSPSLSPDGRRVVFSSARWSALATRNLGILDLQTLSVFRITGTEFVDEAPSWSPDGGRIAFARRRGMQYQMCLIHVDGTQEQCSLLQTRREVRHISWESDTVLLVVSSEQVSRVHADSGTMRVIDSSGASRVISPDGRYIAQARIGDLATSTAWTLAPSLEPEKERRIDVQIAKTSKGFGVLFRDLQDARPSYLDTLRINENFGNPVVGVPHNLHYSALTSTGVPLILKLVQWSSSVPAVATVDSAGVLTPKQPGITSVGVSYDGWRVAQREVEVLPATSRLVFREQWNALPNANWHSFGIPKPVVIKDEPNSGSMLNNGDGIFESGVYSARSYDTSKGLAIDTWISAAITGEQWQVLNIGLAGNIDSAAFDRWDQGDAWAFALGRGATWECRMRYPTGPEKDSTYSRYFSIGERNVPANPVWKSGRRLKARVQYFPDGSCGLAIDGRVVAHDPRPRGARSRGNIFIYGSSFNTKMLVGPVSIIEGVPGGIDWSKVARD